MKLPDVCCFFWDLQAGTIISAVILFSVFTISALVNLVMSNPEDDSSYKIAQYTVVYVYLTFGIAISLLSLFAANYEMGKLMLLSGILTFLLVVYYTFLLIMSFSQYRYVCIYNRCPELHWFEVGFIRSYWIPCRKEERHWEGTFRKFNINNNNLELTDDLGSNKISQYHWTNRNQSMNNYWSNHMINRSIIDRNDLVTFISDEHQRHRNTGQLVVLYFLIIGWFAFLFHTIFIFVSYWIQMDKIQLEGIGESSV